MADWYSLPGDLRGPEGPPGPPGGPGYLAGPVPAGSVTPRLAHDLGSYDIVVWVRDTSTWAWTPAANRCVDPNTVELEFTTAPTEGQYRYLILSAAPPVTEDGTPHTHTGADIAGLAADLAAKADTDHTHSRTEIGMVEEVLNSGWIALTSAGSLFEQSFTTTQTGRIDIRQNSQFTPAPGQGYAGRPRIAPTLAGIELIRASDGAVLVSDRNWSEGYVLDTGYDQYGLCNLSTETLSPGPLPPGNYRARAVVWSTQVANTPRVSLQRLKTKWLVIP